MKIEFDTDHITMIIFLRQFYIDVFRSEMADTRVWEMKLFHHGVSTRKRHFNSLNFVHFATSNLIVFNFKLVKVAVFTEM